ncbi:MAG: hypothetical protein ACHQ50_02615 [Fimbriimonadales bacterium]
MICTLAAAISLQIATGLPESWAVRDWMTAERVARSAVAICSVVPPETHPKTKLYRGMWFPNWASYQEVAIVAETGEVQGLTWLATSGTFSRDTAPDASRIASVRSIALAFGMPKDATVDPAPSEEIRFQWLPEGHKFPAPCYGRYFLDAEGRLIRLGQFWHIHIDADKLVISLSSAVRTASPYYLSQMHDYDGLPAAVDLKASGLGYVSGRRYDHLRLAWIVCFGGRKVYVDAGNGKIIGADLAYKL